MAKFKIDFDDVLETVSTNNRDLIQSFANNKEGDTPISTESAGVLGEAARLLSNAKAKDVIVSTATMEPEFAVITLSLVHPAIVAKVFNTLATFFYQVGKEVGRREVAAEMEEMMGLDDDTEGKVN